MNCGEDHEVAGFTETQLYWLHMVQLGLDFGLAPGSAIG